MSTIDVIGTEIGGRGKTEMAIALAANAEADGHPYTVAEIDNVARLSRYLGEDKVALSLRVSKDMEEILSNREALRTHLDPWWELVCSAPTRVLTDLGANSTGVLLNYMQQNAVAELAEMLGLRFRFTSPATNESASLTESYNFLMRAHSMFGDKADYFLIRNKIAGDAGFAAIETQAYWKAFLKQINGINASILDIGYLDSPLPKTLTKPVGVTLGIVEGMFEAVKAGRTEFTDKDQVAVLKALGLDANAPKGMLLLHLGRAAKAMNDWIRDTSKALEPIYATGIEG